MRFQNRVALALLSIAAAALCGCGRGASQETPPPEPKVEGNRITFPADNPQLKALVVDAAAEREGVMHRLTGRVVWDEDRTVRLYTPFAGRVESLGANVGDKVTANQRMAVIGSPDFAQTVAESRKSQADYALAEKTLARQRELLDHGVAAAKDVQAAEADFQRARAEVDRTRARAAVYGGGGDDHSFVLRSPMPGVVVEKNVNPGQEVRPDQLTSAMPPLFVVTNPSRLWAQLDATEQDLALLHRGQVVTLRTPAYPGVDFPATIASIPDFIDPASRVIKIRADVDNTLRKLKGEMFVTARIKEEGRRALMIPAAATFLVGDRHYAFVERKPGEFERVEIGVGKDVDGWMIVNGGLSPGQRVVTAGALYLQQMLQTGNAS